MFVAQVPSIPIFCSSHSVTISALSYFRSFIRTFRSLFVPSANDCIGQRRHRHRLLCGPPVRPCERGKEAGPSIHCSGKQTPRGKRPRGIPAEPPPPARIAQRRRAGKRTPARGKAGGPRRGRRRNGRARRGARRWRRRPTCLVTLAAAERQGGREGGRPMA